MKCCFWTYKRNDSKLVKYNIAFHSNKIIESGKTGPVLSGKLSSTTLLPSRLSRATFFDERRIEYDLFHQKISSTTFFIKNNRVKNFLLRDK